MSVFTGSVPGLRRPSTSGSSASYETARSSASALAHHHLPQHQQSQHGSPPYTGPYQPNLARFLPSTFRSSSGHRPFPTEPLSQTSQATTVDLNIGNTSFPRPDSSQDLLILPHLSSSSHGTVTTDDGASSSVVPSSKLTAPTRSDGSAVSTPPSSASTPKPAGISIAKSGLSSDTIEPVPAQTPTRMSQPSAPGRPSFFSGVGLSMPFLSSRKAPLLRHVSKKPELRTVSAPLASDGTSSGFGRPISSRSGSFGGQIDRLYPPNPGRQIEEWNAATHRDTASTGSRQLLPLDRLGEHGKLKPRSFTTSSSDQMGALSSLGAPPTTRKPSALRQVVNSSSSRLDNDPEDGAELALVSPDVTSTWPSLQTAVRGSATQDHRRVSSMDERLRRVSTIDGGRSTGGGGGVYIHDRQSLSRPPSNISKYQNDDRDRLKRDSLGDDVKYRSASTHGRSQSQTAPPPGYQSDEQTTGHQGVLIDDVSMAAGDLDQSIGVPASTKTEVRTEVVVENDENGNPLRHHYYHYYHHHHYHHIVPQMPSVDISSEVSSATEVGKAVAVPIHHLNGHDSNGVSLASHFPPVKETTSSRDRGYRTQRALSISSQTLSRERRRSSTSSDEMFFDVMSADESEPERRGSLVVRSPSPSAGVRLDGDLFAASHLSSPKGVKKETGLALQDYTAAESGEPGLPQVTVIPATPMSSAETGVATSAQPVAPPVRESAGPETAVTARRLPKMTNRVRRYSDSLARAIHPATSAIERRLSIPRVRERVQVVKNRAFRPTRSLSHGSAISDDGTRPEDERLHPDWIPRRERVRLHRSGYDSDADVDGDGCALPPGGDTSDVEDDPAEPSRLRTWSGKFKSALSTLRKERYRRSKRPKASKGPAEIASQTGFDRKDTVADDGVAIRSTLPGDDGNICDGTKIGMFSERLGGATEPATRGVPIRPPIQPAPAPSPRGSFYTHANNSSAQANLIPALDRPEKPSPRRQSSAQVHPVSLERAEKPSPRRQSSAPARVPDLNAGVRLDGGHRPSAAEPPVAVRERPARSLQFADVAPVPELVPRPVIAAPAPVPAPAPPAVAPAPVAAHAPVVAPSFPLPPAAPRPAAPAAPRPMAAFAPPVPSSSTAMIVPWGESPAKALPAPPPAPATSTGLVDPIPISAPFRLPSAAPTPPSASASPVLNGGSPQLVPLRPDSTPIGGSKLRPRHPPSAFLTRGFADSFGGQGVSIEPQFDYDSDDGLINLNLGGVSIEDQIGMAPPSRHLEGPEMALFGDEVLADGLGDSIFSDDFGGDDGFGGFGQYVAGGQYESSGFGTFPSEDDDDDDDQ